MAAPPAAPDRVAAAFDALAGGGVSRRELDWARPDLVTEVIAVQERVATECDGRHQVVSDSGHYLHVDRPDLVIACVEEVVG
jgi:hypothetical protein